MEKIVIVGLIIVSSLYAGITGCKYKADIMKLKSENVPLQFRFDNHCNNIYAPADWKRLKIEGKYTQIQSPHPGEENYKYWVVTNELPQPAKKVKKKTIEKKDLKSAFEYGDLIWQDSLINETKLMKFKEAKKYCQTLTYKSYSDWRLPTLTEFRQIRPVFKKYQPYNFKHLQLKEWYWTDDVSDQFVFSTGATTYGGNNPALVRCVTHR